MLRRKEKKIPWGQGGGGSVEPVYLWVEPHFREVGLKSWGGFLPEAVT